MKITVEKVTDWDLVYKTALFTQGKVPKKQFPSQEWKRKTVIAQHSPLRTLQFLVTIEDVPSYIHGHLVRHIHMEKYIRTMREDLTGVINDEITRNTPNNGMYLINAQEMIHISNARLCYKASKETREVWENVVEGLSKIEPELAQMCQPNCIKLGYCPEYQPCGFNENKEDYRTRYLSFILGGDLK